MDNESRKWLYKNLRMNGYNVGNTQEEFDKLMDTNEESRKWAYDRAQELGYNVGKDYNEFTSLVGPEKPAQTQANTEQAAAQAGEAPRQDAAKPTWQQSMAYQMQAGDIARSTQQSMQDFNTRMENIRKGNTLGKTSDYSFNPESGKMEQRYYTTQGDEVTTPTEQSRLNLRYRDEWEATTEEGRKHREERMQNDYEGAVNAALAKFDPDNAALQVWQQAEDKARDEFGNYQDERSKPSWNNLVRGAADGMNVTGGLGADNVDTGIKAFATHLKYHDLQRMANDAWNMLGTERQQAITDDIAAALKNRYPQATDGQIQQAAKEMAREQSDRRLYELAVAKNAPRDAAEYFIRKVAAANAMDALMQAAARQQAGTTGDWEAREDAEQRFEKQGHKVAGIAGTVTGFALDPLMWASGGVSSLTVKGSMWLGGKLLGEAAMRKFGSTLAGRLITGAIGGGANFATFEAGGEALDQTKWGSYIDEETGERKEGFSWGNVGRRAEHGALMGSITGTIAPFLGNVSDKLVKATESTAGKLAVRTGELGVGTLAEGTIFAVPELIQKAEEYNNYIDSLSDENSPNYIADEQQRTAKIEELRNQRGEAMQDVWTDNMAMIAGFKAQHLLKSAPARIAEYQRLGKGKAGFETRMRMMLDGTHPELALTDDEKKELEGKYDDLKELTEEYKRYAEAKEEYDKAHPNTTDAGRMIGSDAEPDIPYNRFTELMNDGSISEAARAKMYYYLTGNVLPMSTVMFSDVKENKDAEGNIKGYTVQSIGANGVITSRTFDSKKRAEVEVNRINRQAELNGFDVGERSYDNRGDQRRMYEACQTVAEEVGAPANLLFELMKEKTEAMDEVELQWVEKIVRAYEELGDKYGSSEVRAEVNGKYGVDVDKAIGKERNRRSDKEQAAVEEYGKLLFADAKQKQEEAAERGEAPVDPNAPTTSSQVAALLGLDEEAPGESTESAAFKRGQKADTQERQDIAIELAETDSPEAQEAWNGVVQRIEEDAAYMAAQQRERNKKMQHADGSIRPAVLKVKDGEGNDQVVYIVDGNVQITPGGLMVSDNIVVVYNPVTGKREQIDPTSDTGISSLGAVATAEQQEADIERGRQEYIQSQLDEAQGTVRFEPGQQLILPTGEEAVVVAIDGAGENITVALADGTQATVQRSELQRIRDEKARKDYRQRHNIADEPQAQQPEAAQAQPQQQQPAANVVSGAPAEYAEGMEITIRDDEDGVEKPAMVMGLVRYENGQFVPDANGGIVEYLMDGEVRHDHLDKIGEKVVNYVVPGQPQPEQAAEAPAEALTAENGLTTEPQRNENGVTAEAQQPAEVAAPEQPAAPTAEVQPQPAEVQPAAAAEPSDAMPMTGTGEDAEPDFMATTPQRGHRYIYDEAGLSREEANQFVSNNIEAANKALDKVKQKTPKMGTSIVKFNKDKAAWAQQVADAQSTVDYWNGVKAEQDNIVSQEIAAQREKDAARQAAAVEAEQQRQAEELARQQEQAERGANAVHPAIRDKWEAAPKIEGAENEITLANGERVKGRYVLVESGAATPSHNPNMEFAPSEGFPVDENGQTVNDRDYERDKDAQDITRSMGASYDSRAIQKTPIVSNDGVVLSGNGRTMAGELAAQNNTDGAYIEHLQKYPQQFGFTSEQVQGMQHPRVLFVPDEAMPYTTETFAKFNQQDMKSQSRTEQSVKLGKTVDDATFGRIIQSINAFDSLTDFYNDPEAATNAIDELRDAGVISSMQYAEMFDGEKVSGTGRQILENMLIGKAFESNPDAIRQLGEYPAMRQSVISALAEISNNIKLGEDYSVENELASAIDLAYQARKSGSKSGEPVSWFARQLNLFPFEDGETVADYTNATVLMLADQLNSSKVNGLKNILAIYNNAAIDAANGQLDIFNGGVKTKQDIINDALNVLDYGTESEQKAALNAAREGRKAAAAGQGGGSQGVQQNGTDDAGEPGREDAGGNATGQGNLAETEVTAPLSDELNEFDKPFVLSSDNTTTFGEVTEDSGLKAAPIKLSLGENTVDENGVNHGYGLLHIEAGHGEQIRAAGFSSVQEFVETVAKNYDTIREGGIIADNQTYLLEISDDHNNTLFIQLSRDGSYWNINSAGIFKQRYSRRKPEVYTRPALEPGTNTDSSGVNSGQTEGVTAPAGNSPQTSEGKDTNKSANIQEKAEVSSPENENTGKVQSEVGKAAEPNAVQTELAAAEQETNTEPTEAQKEAGNYKKGHVKIDGYDITIENPKGSERSGTDASGKKWSITMNNTYGYIRGTEGVDGDHIDVFFSDDPSQGDVFVVDQVNKDGSFDEHKVMYGFPDIESARKAYLSNYEDGWQGLGAITPVSKEEFKKWINSSHRKTKPFAKYSSVETLGDIMTENTAFSIEPTTYTNKKGKTTPMHLVTFGRELSKEELRAGKELARESRGWWDSKQGGFMMRDEESAKALAEALGNEEAVQDAQPMSAEDMAAVSDQAEVKAVDEAIKVEQEPQTVPQYDYDREENVLDTVLAGLRDALNNRTPGSIPNINAIEKEIRDLRKRIKAIEDGMPTAAGETVPQAFAQLADLNGRRRAYERFLGDLRRKMEEDRRDEALAAHGVKLGDKVIIRGKEATIHDADERQVTLDTGLAPVMYEVADWDKVEIPNKTKEQAPKAEATKEEPKAEEPKQKEKKAKSKWVNEEDQERFEKLQQRLRKKIWGQLNVGVDPEILAIGVEMSYLMLKHGARKFNEFAKNLIEALGEEVRPYIKAFYNGARDLPEMEEYEKDMTPYDEVRQFDVMNFDKKGAKDIVATAEHVAREQVVEREAKEATDKLKQERNEERKENEQQVAADTEAIASEAAAVAGEVESKLPSTGNEQEVNDLAKSVDDAIDKVNEQLAVLGYYEAEPVAGDYNEYKGYMLNAEKKAVRNVTELFKTLTKELGISDPVVYDAKGKKQKSVSANIAPAGGDVTMRLTLDRDKGIELYMDFSLQPDYENSRDNLKLTGIMYRVEQPGNSGQDRYLTSNEYFPTDVTVKDMLEDIRRVAGKWLPKEDYVAMAQRISEEKTQENAKSGSKISKSKKKAVSLQQQTIPDLFSGLFDEEGKSIEPQNSNDHDTGRENRRGSVEVPQGEPSRSGSANDSGLDTSVSERGHDGRGDSSVQGGAEQVRSSIGRSSGRLQGLSDRERKPEPAPLAESERKNTHNNHAERGTDYAPQSVNARIEANIAAIETMQRLIESGQQATPEDMSVLRRFSGWGGLGAAFKEKDGWVANPVNKRLREILSPDAYEAANMSRNSAYYTPAPVIDTMWDVARAMGFRGGSVLEGSAGIGNIIGLMPADMSERSDIHAVEIDETTGNILSLLYPDAKVEVKGFEKTHVPNGSVDLAITNVPFVTGLRVMDETGDKDLSRKFHDIHDFCIAKNVRKLKEGGVGIFITSSGTLDSPNSSKLRNWLVNEGGADVVGAFRMHNQTFGGTGATSDIIVIRKRVNGQKSANAIDVSGTLPIRTVKYDTGETKRGSSEIIIKDLVLDVNKHFVEHPEDMAGEMAFAFEKGDNYRATSKALYPRPDINQEQRLSEWARQFADMDWDKAEERETQQVVYENLGEDVKEGSMLLDGNGNLCLAQRGKAVPISVNENKVKGHTKAECFNDYKAIKDALADVLEYQTANSDDKGLKPLLDRLNKAYDDFVKTYGHLNKNTSISFLRNDMDYPSIAALESVSESNDNAGKRVATYGKTDVFSHRVVEKESEPKPTTIKDGIIASIYLNGRVDVPYIAEQLNMSDGDVRRQIVESGLGFENPTTTEMEVSYEYLSGNVREKLRQAQENNADGRYDANIKALERVIPMDIPSHLIEFTLGSSWVEPKLYEDFVKERTGIDVTLTNAGGTWIMKEPYWTDTEQNKAMGVISEKCDKTILGHELIKAAITCKTITVSKTVSTGYGSNKTTETIVDNEATMACANKVDEIRQDFKDWARGRMQNDPEMAERMERVYNELFNNSVPKEIPDEFVPEHFGGAATVVNGKPFKLRPHQAKAAIRATTQPLMLAHEVGSGKTYTLITTAMEMRRLGTARKPMIVVQNATVGQFVASAKALYPNAKILTLEDADRNAEGRRNFYAKIRYNDWDMIVVPQSVFERIPDSEERQIRFIEDKIEEKMMVLEKMREAADDSRDPVVRQAERELEQLGDELNELKLSLQVRKSGGKAEKDEKREAKTRQNAMVKAQEMLDRETDDVADFDDMGIDALLVDEAHEYKHLGFATAMQRGVKGVDPSYSKKSQGVYLKTQAVLEKNNGKNVVFATGTPISNTAAEIWTFMRYLMPADTMREYGIYYFDDFVRNFGNIQQMLEFATNGKYKENNRFAGYVNLPELVRIWSGITDTVLNREVEAQRKKEGGKSAIPKMEDDKAQDIYLPQTKALRGVMKYVKDQLDEYEKMSGKQKKKNSHIPLVMYGIAKAAAVDARLVLEDAEDEPNSKTNEAVRQTLRSLEETKKYKGTVAIFADNYQNKATGFNIYEDIRKKLIEAGVPEDQVVVMKSGMSIKKKLEIFDKVNRGDVRVIMGSTFTLGTGVNIQERLHTLIHVDAPNRPMDYTQRNGRILRQGNLHNDWGIPVRVLRFGVEDSLDVTAYQRLKTKGAIADSIMEGKKMMDNSMENRVLEEEQDLFGDITAQLSGSQYALLKNQVEKEVKKLEARKKQYEADQTYVHNQKPRLKGLIKSSEESAADNRKYLAKVEAAKNDGITIGKTKYPSIDAMADYIKDYNSKQREQQEQVRTAPGYDAEAKSDLTISAGGFDFKVNRVITKERKQERGQLSLSFYSKTQMTYSCPELGLEDVPVEGQRLKSALEDIVNNVLSGDDFRERAENAERAAERYKGELKQVEARDGKPFEYAGELKQAKEKLAEYEELMKAEMAEKEAKYAEMDASVEAANGVRLTDEDSEDTSEDAASYRTSEELNEEEDAVSAEAQQTSPEAKRKTVEQMGEKLHTPINIIEDVNEITHPNAEIQERRRKAKGWYDRATGKVNIVLANNKDVDDVKATVGHETIAHKGLRELVGEENYGEFLDETYRHLRDDLKKGVDEAAGRAFVDDTTNNGERAKSYEEHRRTATDELFGRMAEKPFEEFSEGERTLWQRIKATVRRLLDKFLGTLKLPKWFEIGDNELRYMLWRSKERMERGKEDPIDLARDIVKREELGLGEPGLSKETRKNVKKSYDKEYADAVKEGDIETATKILSKAFKEAFPNTKIVDKDGNPIVVFHGSPYGAIRVFDHTKGASSGLKEYGTYFTTNKTLAKIYKEGRKLTPELREEIDVEIAKYENILVNARNNQEYDAAQAQIDILKKAKEGKIYACYLNVEHPKEFDAEGADGWSGWNKLTQDVGYDVKRGREAIEAIAGKNSAAIMDETYDGIIAHNIADVHGVADAGFMGDAILVFKPGQIKSAEVEYDDNGNLISLSERFNRNNDDFLYRDGDETGDIWSDQSMSLQERMTAAAIRLANNHSDNKTLRNDAMRAIGGNLADLRRAMSLQRTFDMTTVKRVADLVRVLMDGGYLNGLSQQEVKRLLAAVKNSVGKNDIERDVQKVMDIMIDNQLKHAEAALQQLEAIRGSKVDARGVEVQGQLDPAGAHIMKVFKKTRGMEKTDIEEALADAQQRMGSSDAAVADEAALDYTGLQLAKEYAENIKDSKVEERNLREEMKQAHDEASERDRDTESYRQYIASVQEAIRQNKIERAESYAHLVGKLTGSLRGSIENARAFKEAEKQRIREIQHNANSDMQGRPSDEHYKPKFMDKFVNNSFVSYVFAPLATFDQMLRMFGGKSANGEGYLYNRFMRGWVDAREKEIKGVREKYAILDAKAAELFGGKVKTWGDLIRRVGKLPKATVSFWNGGEMQEHELTQGNLMYIYMVDKMLDGRMKLRRMGITEEDIEDIENALDPRLIQLADWLQDEFLVDTRNEYNKTHKRMFGASMSAIEHYFPLKILANARADKPEDLDNPDKGDGISTATGSIIKRRRNSLALDITGADALSVILDHVAQMEHWNAYAEFNRDLNTLRTYRHFRNQVQNMTTIYGSGKELWRKFNDVCQMAAGTYRPPRTKLDEAAVNFAKGVTAAKVSFRVFTALKQFLSWPAFIPETRPDYLLANLANPVKAWKWSMENMPIFDERWRSRMAGDPRLLKSDMDWKMWRTRIVQLASRVGMAPNAFVDALTISIGAHSIYQTRKARYLREGYNEEQAERKAIQDAETLYNETQQSSEGAFTSTMQVDRSWLSVMFTVFRNASMSYTRQLYDALRNLKHNLTPGGRARSIEFMTKQLLREWNASVDGEGNWSAEDTARAEKAAKSRFNRQLLKDTLRVATFGYIMQLAWNLGAYLPYLLFGGDDDEKQKMWDDVWAHTMFGSVEGLTGGDVMSDAGRMLVTGEGNPAYLSKDMPLTSDFTEMLKKLGSGKHTEALNDITNLVVQSGIGVNPQSITDGVLAIMDACGDDPELAHEASICVMRILQMPQSQIDKIYFDEIGLSGKEVSKYTPSQLAERYARFKVKRSNFFAPWAWDDEKSMEKFTKKADKTIKERTAKMGDAGVNDTYLQYEEVYKGIDERVKAARKLVETDYVKAAQMMASAQDSKNFTIYEEFKAMDGNLDKFAKGYLASKTPEEAALYRETMLRYKSAMVEVLDAGTQEERKAALGTLSGVIEDFSKRYKSLVTQ